MALLEITNLHASVEERQILNGIELVINTGEVHAIMGPNGSGKSSLSYVLSGRDGYEVTSGQVSYQGNDLLKLEPEIRAREGVFLAFQYPTEIPGVTTTTFLRTAVNSIRKHRGESEYDAMQFVKHARAKAAELGIDEDMLKRSINTGFSGGEKKRAEVLQMVLLEPKLAILDETDSGLDIDALKVVANGVNTQRSADRGMLIITHYQRLLEYIIPDHVHVLSGGKIVKSGGSDLALELEKKGYREFLGEAA